VLGTATTNPTANGWLRDFTKAAEQRAKVAHSASCGFKVRNGTSSGRSERKITPRKIFLPPRPGRYSFNDLSHGSRRGLLSSATPWLGKANVVFCDGHVESPMSPFLFTDTSAAALSRWNRDHQPRRERLAQ
jgi:prepilin-type processing-associated H-X9-DG protein